MIPAHRAPLETNQQRHATGTAISKDPLAYQEFLALMRRIRTALKKVQDEYQGEISMARFRAEVTIRQGRSILTFNVRRPRGQ